MNKKRVLIYSQTFAPDHSGISIYSSDFAFYCVEQGYAVDVITGYPFYPQWQKRPQDRAKLFSKEILNGASIYRGYLYVARNPSSFQRILHELSLFFFAFLNSFRVKRPDVIVVFTTPVLLGVLAAFMNLFWRRKLVINVQDFQIEAAYSLKMLSGSGFLKVLNRLELWSYRQAQLVSSISQSMVDMLTDVKKMPEGKVLFWPNWIQHVITTNGLPAKGQFRQRFGIPNSTRLIGYAGNIGKKQGLEILIDVAGQFASNPDVLFLIVGEGSGLESLKQYAHTKQVSNVRFMPFLSPHGYSEYLCDANAVFISQAKVPFDIYFPSKLLGVMLVGRPIIISADANSELYKTMKKNNLALVADYGDTNSLKDFTNYVINEHPLIDRYVKQSKEFVRQYERTFVLSKVLSLIT